MNKSIILRIAICGVFSGLCFVLTAFCQIPYAGRVGYLNLGDLATLLIAMALGPIEGAIVGMIGGSLGDAFLGYGAYVPFTLLAKGIMGAVTGICFMLLRKRKVLRFVSGYIGATMMIGVYMICYAVLQGPALYLSSAFDCVQGYGMATLVIPLYLGIEKSGVLARLQRKDSK